MSGGLLGISEVFHEDAVLEQGIFNDLVSNVSVVLWFVLEKE